MGTRLFVEGWDPEFGTSTAFAPGELEPSHASIDPDVEVTASSWMPISPTPPADPAHPAGVAFVDGVRRIDAIVWIREADGSMRLGICASCAAGMVTCNQIGPVATLRGLFTAAERSPLETSVGSYRSLPAEGESVAELTGAVQTRLRELETRVASQAPSDATLVVVDGPLSKQHTKARAIGYVKTHRVSYLDETLTRTVHGLAPGERTPMFRTTTSWERFSSYLRLPGPLTHPWAGIVRIEVAGTTPLEQACALVNAAQSTLPRYASVPHKEPRAPQNLFPIGGLERELRRRLGDAYLVHRAIRVAASV